MAKRKTNKTAKKTTPRKTPVEVPVEIPVEEEPIISKESVQNAKYLNEQLAKSQEILEGISELDSIGIENYADKLQLSQKLQETAEQIATVMGIMNDYSKQNVKNGEFLIQNYGDQVSLLDIVRSKLAESVVNSGNILKDSFEMVDISQELKDYARQRNELELVKDDLSKKDYDRQSKLLDLVKDRLDSIEEINKSQETANKLATDYLKSNTLLGLSTNNLIGSLESMKSKVGTGSLGIIGEFLGNKAGNLIEKTREDIESKIVLAFQNSGTAAVSAFSMAKIAVSSFAAYALPALGILGLLGIIGGLVGMAKHLDEELSEIGKTLGISRHEAEEFHHIAKDIASEMKIVGINSKEVGESMISLSGILGGLSITKRMEEGSEATKQMIEDVAVLQNTFGLASDESGGIGAISDFATIMGKSMGQVTKESVKLGKGLLTTKQSIMVVGKIAPNIAIAFKKGSVELLKAAQRAKLLGIELEDVQDFGDKILDFESSLESEMTARVITGRKINFDLARQYALQGDVASLQEEMLTQLGSMQEFQSMNRLQQKYMADAFGMTVDEVAKLLAAQERLNDLGIDQTKMDEIQMMNAQQLTEEMQNTSNEKLKGYLQTLAKEKESAAINERISDAMTKIKERLASTLTPLLEQVHHFLDSAEGAEFLESVVGGIESTMKAIVPIVKFLAEHMWILAGAIGVFAGAKMIKGASTIMGLFKGIGGAASAAKPSIDAMGGAFGDLSKEMGTATEAGDALNQSMGGAGGAAQGVAGFTNSFTSTAVNMVLVGVALIAFAGALWITAKAFQEFAKLSWDDVEKGIRVMWSLTAVTAVLTVLAVAITESGAILALLALAGAIGVFALSMMGIGYAAKMFAEAVSTMADGLKKFISLGNISKISSQIREVVSAISNIGGEIDPSKTAKLRKSLENLGIDKLVEFGKIANVDLGKAGQNIINAIDSLSKINLSKDLDFGAAEIYTMAGTVKGKGIIGALQKLDQAIGQLELEHIEALSKLATTDMTNLGKNIKNAIDSLTKIDLSGSIEPLKKLQETFSQLYDTLMLQGLGEGGGFGQSDLYLEPLKDIASIEIDKVLNVTSKLKDVIYTLADIGAMTQLSSGMKITDGLDSLQEVLRKLSEALNQLDADKLKDISNINADNLARVASVFRGHEPNVPVSQYQQPNVQYQQPNVQYQQPQTVQPNGYLGITSTTSNESTETNKKLDQVINVLNNLLKATNQPTQINIGGRTIETIGLQIQGMKNRTIGINANGGITGLQ